MLKKILIVGGSSGLGLELAKKYTDLGHTVFITGRHDPKVSGLKFYSLQIDHETTNLTGKIDSIVSDIKEINTFVYAAGFYQEGHIDQLTDEQILKMINVGLTAPAFFIQRLKNHLGNPLKVMLITSSSQFTPRELEPMYTAVKGGLGMLGRSLALDKKLGKILVIAPCGMKTGFWDKNKDVSEYLNPKWVADQIIDFSGGPFKYRFAKILRSPQRVEIVETLQDPSK